jgi:prevent-host-death family protein
MRTISAGDFKTHCLRIMEEVRRRRETVVITKRGVPVAKVVPAEEPRKDVFGCMAGTAEITGDIERPVVPTKAWRATS